jgi:hypothetical protein
VERIRVILSGEYVMDEEAIGPDGTYPPEEERPAFDVIFEGEDPAVTLRSLTEEIVQGCDRGTIIITPCWTAHGS